jgi:ornithine cyclodeaminase/alanine dehydrogenase-like protein (mu-crystallin family)
VHSGLVRILTDVDVRAAPAAAVVAAAREALERFAEGQLLAPPRVMSDLGVGWGYVFTVGAQAGGVSGFRAYRVGDNPGDQMVAVWDESGTLTGVVVGDEIGARRTGALGAVAADALARPEAEVIGVVGSGRQAWTQLWALTAVRSPSSVRVYSPASQHREAFAARARDELHLPARAVAGAADAVRDADIVLIATRSARPVIAAHDVSPGAHVTTVGPKSRSRHEIPIELVDAAAVVTCDSPVQAQSYQEPFFTDPTALISLGDVLIGRSRGRQHPEEVTLHCSVGLAGSEVMLAQQLLQEPPV